MRKPRQLPTVVKVATTMRSYYQVKLHIIHVSTTDFGLRSESIGRVRKVGSKWNATLELDFGGDDIVRVFLDGFTNMRTAIHAMRETFEVIVDEHEAYRIVETIAQAQAKAEQDAPVLLGQNEEQHALVVPARTMRSLIGSNEELADDLRLLRGYLSASPNLTLHMLHEFAYTGRMIEHELIRRANELTTECEEFARRGTGYGSCEAPLDEHGNCPNADNHRDSHTLRPL